MEDEVDGFCFDEAFVNRIHKHLKKTKKIDRCEELLCATIVAEFLAKYEIKTKSEICH